MYDLITNCRSSIFQISYLNELLKKIFIKACIGWKVKFLHQQFHIQEILKLSQRKDLRIHCSWWKYEIHVNFLKNDCFQSAISIPKLMLNLVIVERLLISFYKTPIIFD